jgi:hypothetical protein
MKLSKKWKEIWLISVVCLIIAIFIFNKDPEFAGYLTAAAILFPAFGWYNEYLNL